MKKAQIQMQETVLVLFILFIIIAIGIAFFYNYNLSSIRSSQLVYQQKQTYTLLSTLPNHPQLKYTYLGNEESSIDTLKLLNINLTDLGFKNILIKQVYPEIGDIVCTTANYPNCNTYQVYSKVIPRRLSNELIITTPVSLYFPLNEQHKAGILEIRWYY